MKAIVMAIVCCLVLHAEVIDRIVAVVNGHIITLSDIRTEKKMREVLGEPIPKNDSELLDELIDQHLIHEQLELFPEMDPAPAELDAELGRIQDLKGLPIETVRAALREHDRRSLFFDVRFRRFVPVSADQIKTYYEDVFVPAARARAVNPIPPLEAVREEIRFNLAAEESAKQIDDWLKQTRKNSQIEVL